MYLCVFPKYVVILAYNGAPESQKKLHLFRVTLTLMLSRINYEKLYDYFISKISTLQIFTKQVQNLFRMVSFHFKFHLGSSKVILSHIF